MTLSWRWNRLREATATATRLAEGGRRECGGGGAAEDAGSGQTENKPIWSTAWRLKRLSRWPSPACYAWTKSPTIVSIRLSTYCVPRSSSQVKNKLPWSLSVHQSRSGEKRGSNCPKRSRRRLPSAGASPTDGGYIDRVDRSTYTEDHSRARQ